MKLNKIIHNLCGHLKTVITHKKYVYQSMRKCGLGWQGFWHDASKFTLKELIPSVKYYNEGLRSPLAIEREKLGYSNGFKAHLDARNYHHARKWVEEILITNPDGTRRLGWIGYKMPSKYVIELLCDKIAAGKVYLTNSGKTWNSSSPLEHWEKEDKYYAYNRKTRLVLEFCYHYLAENGEEKFYKLVKANRKNIYKLIRAN